MKLPAQDIDVFNNIDFRKVAEYLQHRNWHEEERVGDRAAIWGYFDKEGRKAEILLPLTRDVPDYASRMDDVFRTLEIVEQRSKAEIFNDLVDVRAIAQEQRREVLNLHLNFMPAENNPDGEPLAENLGDILESMQNLFDSIGQAKVGRPNPAGRVAKQVTDRTKLSILGTFEGSFGIRLALSANQQLNLIDQPLAELVVEDFLKLLRQSSSENLDELSFHLRELQQRVTSNYRKFMLAIVDANANISIDWGSLNPNRGGSAALTTTDAFKAVEGIQDIEPEEPKEYEIVGELLAASEPRKTFLIRDIKDKDKKSFSGKIADEVIRKINDKSVELTIRNFYVATIREEVSISSTTNEGKVEHTLIDIDTWHSDIAKEA